jgi:ATP-dependent DNA ligase
LFACRDDAGIRLLTRNGNDFTARYPLIVEAVGALPVRSCVIDGEAVACDGKGLSIFEKLRWRHQPNAHKANPSRAHRAMSASTRAPSRSIWLWRLSSAAARLFHVA